MRVDLPTLAIVDRLRFAAPLRPRSNPLDAMTLVDFLRHLMVAGPTKRKCRKVCRLESRERILARRKAQRQARRRQRAA